MSNENAILTIEDRPMPKVLGRGRKRGSGSNMHLLDKLVPGGSPVFDVPKNKMLSLRCSASAMGIKIKVRAIPDLDGNPTDRYAIQRIT